MHELHRTSLWSENISRVLQSPVHLPFLAFPGSSSTKGDFALLLAPRGGKALGKPLCLPPPRPSSSSCGSPQVPSSVPVGLVIQL